MRDKKTVVRFFTIADYEEEEVWLREQHKNGWKLASMTPPCFYVFESCAPEDVAYRLDYKNNTENSEYFQLFGDYGWEYVGHCVGWLYFRKPVLGTDTQQDVEIFSDDSSRIDMVDHIIKTRMLPLLIIFLACVVPNFVRTLSQSTPFFNGWTVLFTLLLCVYLYLFIHCGTKLRRLRQKYNGE